MSKKRSSKGEVVRADGAQLFQRVAAILDQARQNVVRSVNSNMVVAYWLIGREIVEEFQGGENRAEYGERMLETLSSQLSAKYGRGYSVANLKNFRQLFIAFFDRMAIRYLPGSDLAGQNRSDPSGSESTSLSIIRDVGDVNHYFSPHLSWSHYRALMRIDSRDARDFYEREAAECGWTKAELERQIHSSCFERIVANRGQEGLTVGTRERAIGIPISPDAILKTPYVLEFLGLPDSPVLHENALEQAIIDNLQSFLLELGKGFAFVARQKHLRFDDEDFYIDLVFYNYILKCFVLVDLKIGKLTHRDVGQLDGYVRLFEDRFKLPGDNPTLGLILCSDKSEAVAKYSVLSEGRQIFASKYLQFLPSEQELTLEIERERRLVEAAIEDASDEAGESDVE